MARALLIITAVVTEGRSKTEVARDCGVSRYWVQQLVQRYQREGPAAFLPRSRRPHHSPHAVDADTEEMIIRLRKELSKQGLDAGAGNHRGASGTPDPDRRPARGAGGLDHLADLVPAGFRQSAAAETAAVVMGHVLRRTAQRTLAGRHHPLAARRRE